MISLIFWHSTPEHERALTRTLFITQRSISTADDWWRDLSTYVGLQIFQSLRPIDVNSFFKISKDKIVRSSSKMLGTRQDKSSSAKIMLLPNISRSASMVLLALLHVASSYWNHTSWGLGRCIAGGLRNVFSLCWYHFLLTVSVNWDSILPCFQRTIVQSLAE